MVTSLKDHNYGAGLKNGLLYASKVHWLPLEPILPTKASDLNLLKFVADRVPSMREFKEYISLERLEFSIKRHMELLENFSMISPLIEVKDYEPSESTLEGLEKWGFSESQWPQLKSTLEQWVDVLAKNPEAASVIFDKTFKIPLNSIIQDAIDYASGCHPKITETISKSDACIVDSELPFLMKPAERWETLDALQKLMQSFQRICLPDVSDLPIEEILKLRERVKDEVAPMRAELLRLTVELRKRVKENYSIEDLAAESDDLIRTQVEPLVLEAKKHIEARFRKRNSNAISGFLRFIGAVWLIPQTPLGFIPEGVKAITDIITAEDIRPPSTTAEFALKLRFSVNAGQLR